MDLGLLAARLVRKLNDDGVAVTVRSAIDYLARGKAADAYDVEHGTETDGLEPLWKLSIRSANARFGERYQATTEHELVAALQSLGQALHTFSFVDLGCGKGRTLLVASRLAFRRVVGVEFADELVAIARRNLRTRDARNAVVVHADAADFEFPPGDLVVYLYNPFTAEVMTQVLANLRAAQGGRLFVIYKAPRCARLLDECGFLVRQGRPQGALHIEVWRRVDPEGRPQGRPGA